MKLPPAQLALLRAIAFSETKRLGEHSIGGPPGKGIAGKLTNAGLLRRVECAYHVHWEITKDGEATLAGGATA